MEINNGNKPAYSALEADNGIMFHEGLTKREYFAGLAMQGICASGPTISDTEISICAISLADTLLEQLNK